MGGDWERNKRSAGGGHDGAQQGDDAQDASISPSLRTQIVAFIARADAWHRRHPELVEEFNRLTGGGCAGGSAGINVRSLRCWQIQHGVKISGVLGPDTMDAARKMPGNGVAHEQAAQAGGEPHAKGAHGGHHEKAAADSAASPPEMEAPPKVAAALDSGDPKVTELLDKPEEHATPTSKHKHNDKTDGARPAQAGADGRAPQPGDQPSQDAANNGASQSAGAAPSSSKGEQPPEDAQLTAALAQPVPDLKTEYDSMVNLAEAQLGRELKPAEINRLMALVVERVTQMQERRALLLRKQHEQVERRILVEQIERGMTFLPDDEAEKKPSFWKLAEAQAYENTVVGSVNVLHGLKEYLLSVGNRSLKLQEEMRERGITNLGSPLTPVAVMARDSVEDISKSLQGTTDAIERCLEAERGTDKAIAAADAVLGLGKAALGAYAIAEPIAALERGGPAGGMGAHMLAAGAEGAGDVAMAGNVAAAIAGDGARLSPAGIIAQLERVTVKADPGRTGGANKPGSESREPAKLEAQRKEQRETSREPAEVEGEQPVKRELPHKPLSKADREMLEAKKLARTITREETERLEWDKRFRTRRARGVRNFWAEERDRLKAGQPGTRAWTDEQRGDILNNKTPKDAGGTPIEGHHKHNAADYPQKAAEPGNIAPATKDEHLNKWHGGNFQNDTSGEPLNPEYEDEF